MVLKRELRGGEGIIDWNFGFNIHQRGEVSE